MTPRFFIDRPVFSWVIALTIVFAGVIALRSLAIEQYPTIAPPSLTISAAYPGADASVLATNVTQVIEQELNGVEGFLYMSSSSQSNGTTSISVTFRSGTNINVAQMDVQNRLRRVEPRLPEEVRRQGVQVVRANTGFLLIIALTSKTGVTPTLELGNFAVSRVLDELRRIPGVGDVRSFSSEYAMRVWLDPAKLATYNLSPSDALSAVQEQNSQSSGGSTPSNRSSSINESDVSVASKRSCRSTRTSSPARPVRTARSRVLRGVCVLSTNSTTSTRRSSRRAASPRRSSSRTSSCAPTPTARSFGWATSRESSSAPRRTGSTSS